MAKPPLPIKHTEEQHCAVTGKAMLPSALLCFVLDPSGKVVFDMKQNLPVEKRLWLCPERAVVEQAMQQQVFSGLDADARCPEDLPQRIEAQWKQRLLENLHLLRRSGALIGGFEKVKSLLASGRAVALVQAQDASDDGRKKLRKMAEFDAIPVITALTQAEIATVTGQENQVHLALLEGGLTARFVEDSAGFSTYIASK